MLLHLKHFHHPVMPRFVFTYLPFAHWSLQLSAPYPTPFLLTNFSRDITADVSMHMFNNFYYIIIMFASYFSLSNNDKIIIFRDLEARFRSNIHLNNWTLLEWSLIAVSDKIKGVAFRKICLNPYISIWNYSLMVKTLYLDFVPPTDSVLFFDRRK